MRTLLIHARASFSANVDRCAISSVVFGTKIPVDYRPQGCRLLHWVPLK
jgi:hypothetical protein